MGAAPFELLNSVPDDHAGESRYVHVVGDSVWIDDRPSDGGWNTHFVGLVGGHAWWAVDVPAHDDPSDGAAIGLRAFYGRSAEAEWLAAGRALQLVEWARTHRFCGRCGEPTVPADVDRAMRCPRCGLVAFPRLSPAMITLVTRGDDGPDQRALLARGTRFPLPMYSCLAGFVEPGESLEDAVHREVGEEVGLAVAGSRYVGSQPWPFPNSLMIGFRADYVSGEIECEPSEIVDAGWYRRDELPMLPPPISIARKIIDGWIAEV